MVKNKEVCAGTFTRITQHSSAILDYVLVSQNMKDDVLRMGIDTKVELLWGSDHVAIRLDIKLVWEPIMTPKTKQCNISLAESS